jgi:hypothetical protein
MHMSLSPSDAVQIDSLRLPAAICEHGMHNLLNGGHKNWSIVFRMPVEMQEDFMIDVGRNCDSPRVKPFGRTLEQLRVSISRSKDFCEWLKPGPLKPAEAGLKSVERTRVHQLKAGGKQRVG